MDVPFLLVFDATFQHFFAFVKTPEISVLATEDIRRQRMEYSIRIGPFNAGSIVGSLFESLLGELRKNYLQLTIRLWAWSCMMHQNGFVMSCRRDSVVFWHQDVLLSNPRNGCWISLLSLLV